MGRYDLCIAHGGDMGEPSGGTDRVSALARGLQDRGFDVTLVTPRPSDPVPARLEPVDLVHVDPPVGNPVARASSVVRRAARVARERGAELQIEHSTLAGVGTLHGIEGYVLDMHDLGYSRFDHVGGPVAPALRAGVRRLERRAVERADDIVVVSESMGAMVCDLWDVPPEAVTVVPNGFFPETVRSVADVSTVPGRVVFFGTLHPKVDAETLTALADYPEVSDLVVIGDGAQRERLEGASASRESMRLTGRLPDAEAFELVASAAVVVNPQTVSAIQRASSPVKLFYYAALGKPMVVTAGPPIAARLVEQDAAVVTVSPAHFVDRVRAALDDDSFATTLAENAEAASAEFRWSRRVDEMVSLYESR
jgi:glycosyltransferase involved in cell wall biosynthesis